MSLDELRVLAVDSPDDYARIFNGQLERSIASLNMENLNASRERMETAQNEALAHKGLPPPKRQ